MEHTELPHCKPKSALIGIRRWGSTPLRAWPLASGRPPPNPAAHITHLPPADHPPTQPHTSQNLPPADHPPTHHTQHSPLAMMSGQEGGGSARGCQHAPTIGRGQQALDVSIRQQSDTHFFQSSPTFKSSAFANGRVRKHNV